MNGEWQSPENFMYSLGALSVVFWVSSWRKLISKAVGWDSLPGVGIGVHYFLQGTFSEISPGQTLLNQDCEFLRSIWNKFYHSYREFGFSAFKHTDISYPESHIQDHKPLDFTLIFTRSGYWKCFPHVRIICTCWSPKTKGSFDTLNKAKNMKTLLVLWGKAVIQCLRSVTLSLETDFSSTGSASISYYTCYLQMCRETWFQLLTIVWFTFQGSSISSTNNTDCAHNNGEISVITQEAFD
jgi:hypothetical protein